MGHWTFTVQVYSNDISHFINMLLQVNKSISFQFQLYSAAVSSKVLPVAA